MRRQASMMSWRSLCSSIAAALLGGYRWFRNLTALGAAASGLLADPLPLIHHTAIEQALHQFDLFHDRIVAPDLPLHGFRRTAAVKRNHRVPAALVARRQVLDHAGNLQAPVLGDVLAATKDSRQRRLGVRVVILVRAR